MDAVHYSSARADWQTPEFLLEEVRRVFGGTIECDPCTAHDNPTRAVRFYTEVREPPADWGERWYCNPPYGRALSSDWATRLSAQTGEGIALLPSRTDTRWFHQVWSNSALVCFVRGRLVFRGAPAPAPFPSAVFYRGPRPRVFASVFSEWGRVV